MDRPHPLFRGNRKEFAMTVNAHPINRLQLAADLENFNRSVPRQLEVEATHRNQSSLSFQMTDPEGPIRPRLVLYNSEHDCDSRPLITTASDLETKTRSVREHEGYVLFWYHDGTSVMLEGIGRFNKGQPLTFYTTVATPEGKIEGSVTTSFEKELLVPNEVIEFVKANAETM